jgi:hypothetical protein
MPRLEERVCERGWRRHAMAGMAGRSKEAAVKGGVAARATPIYHRE